MKLRPTNVHQGILRRACKSIIENEEIRSRGSLPDPNSKLRIRAIRAGPQLQALDRSVPCRTSTASARSQCSLPNPNSKLRIRVFPTGLNCNRKIAVFPAGPEQQAPDQSVPRRTPTASARSQCSAGPEQQAPDRQIECQNICQIECHIECQNISQIDCQNI